ncbi:gamma-glutamyltranspeptidase [Coniochaeta sp. 2T2.1]|nr:gamma-glutamyltranspeptidase [Coniochaeta sp. 2T2.1]
MTSATHTRTGNRRRLRGGATLLSLAALVASSPIQEQVTFQHTKGLRGAVASESKICSQVGIDLLERGGNAADAFVAAQLCVGVIGMYHSGIGGGGFMLVRDKDGNYESIDYRETAPAAAHRDMFQGNVEGSIFGGLSAGVPGELRGLEYVHTKYGVLPWKAVVMPAAHVARDGFPVTDDLIRYMKFAKDEGADFLDTDPVWAQDFAPNGTLVKLGDTMTRERLADTLETIAIHGPDVFYTGPMAQSMVDTIQATNGTMTMQDLADYKILVRDPLSIDYRGYRVFANTAPSSGSVTLSMLKTMEQYPLSDRSDANLTTHRFDEAMRFAYGARVELGDPNYIRNIEQYENNLISNAKAEEISRRIKDNETQPVEAYDPNGTYSEEGFGTSHIVAADGSGMAISSTTTLNLLFGAQIMTPDTGIILNDQMNDFSIPGVRNAFGYVPSPSNFISPGKRPLSSCTPVIVEHGNGTLFFTTGGAGGSRIISATAQTVWRVVEHGMNMTQAVAEPRLHDQLMPNQVTFEWTFDNATVASMEGKGHNVTWVRLGVSAVQAIRMLWDGGFESVGEPRQRNSGGLSL